MNPFEQLQAELASVIAADPLFAEVEVMYEERGDSLATANRMVESQLRCVNVVTPEASLQSPNLPGPFYDNVPVEIEVMGFPEACAGDGGPTVRDMSHAIASILHHFTPESSGQVMVARNPVITNVPSDTDGAVTDLVRFNCPLLGRYEVPALVLTADLSGDPITLTGATPGAAIFYTVDGKYPAPRNGTLYTGPIDRPAAGTRFKARAWLAGYLPSNQISATL